MDEPWNIVCKAQRENQPVHTQAEPNLHDAVSVVFILLSERDSGAVCCFIIRGKLSELKECSLASRSTRTQMSFLARSATARAQEHGLGGLISKLV